MNTSDALKRGIRRSRSLLRSRRGRLRETELLSPEVMDLLRQLEGGAELRRELGSIPPRRARPPLAGMSPVAPLSSGLRRLLARLRRSRGRRR